MERISEFGFDWLNFRATKLPRWRAPQASTLPELLSKLCDCDVDVTVESLMLDKRIELFEACAVDLPDALERMACEIESWQTSEDGAFVCPDVDYFRERASELSSAVDWVWVNVCAVDVGCLEPPRYWGDSRAETTLNRLAKVVNACGLSDVYAALIPVINSREYRVVEAAWVVEEQLANVAFSDDVQVGSRLVRSLREAASDLRTCLAAAKHRGAATLSQAQIAKAANVSERTVYTIAKAAGIGDKTGGAPYTADEINLILAKAKTGGTRKPGWSRVASILGG